MPEPVRVRLFVEDAAHEAVVGSLIGRLANSLAVRTVIATATARGGQPRVLAELRAFLRLLEKRTLPDPIDILVVVVDANCRGDERRQEIAQVTAKQLVPYTVVGCPKPHVERWLLLDPQALQQVLGVSGCTPPATCERDTFKHCLADLASRAGHPKTPQPAVELAPEIVEAMRIQCAERRDNSFRAFVKDLRVALKSAAR